jgi:hypothetical protein
VEVINASMFNLEKNKPAMELALQAPVAQVGNSDGHVLRMIGKGATTYDGISAMDLRRALLARATKAVMGIPDSRTMLYTHWFSRIALRHVGWVSCNSSPQAPIQFSQVFQKTPQMA